MKLLASIILVMASNAFASETVFSCKGPKARQAIMLNVTPSFAELGSQSLLRDKTYVPGNDGKFYYRYSNEVMDVLVPKLIATNRENQGVIVVYTAEGKVRLSCIK